jgi:Zn-dependent protease
MIELHLGKTLFRFRFGFFAAVALLFLFYEGKTAIWSLYACILHEAGHLAAIHLCGVPVRSVMLYFAGIRIDTKHPRQFLPPLSEIFILASGVTVNFAVFLALLPFRENENAALFCAVNLVIGLFNLLPLTGFDGGRLLSAAVRLLCSDDNAERLFSFRKKTDIALIPAAALIFFILGNRNISLYATLIYFMIITITEDI